MQYCVADCPGHAHSLLTKQAVLPAAYTAPPWRDAELSVNSHPCSRAADLSSCTAPPFPSPGGGHAALVVLPGPGDVPTQPFAALAVLATNTLCSATMIDRPPTTGGAGPSRLMPPPEPAAAVALEATGGKHHPRV